MLKLFITFRTNFLYVSGVLMDYDQRHSGIKITIHKLRINEWKVIPYDNGK